MKIAIFSDCYLDLTGGITTAINAEKHELEKRGHSVYVFSSAYPRSPEAKARLARSHIFPVPSCRFFLRGLTPVAKGPKTLEKWLEKNFPELKTFDIFYIHYEASCSLAGLLLAKKYHIPSVQVMHGREDVGEANIIPFGFRTIVADALRFGHSRHIPHQIKVKTDGHLAKTFAEAKMWTIMVNHANSPDILITPSNSFAKKLKHYGVKREIIVLENGVRDELFLEGLEPRTLKKGEPLKIIWHSRVSAEKRIMPFLRALKKLPPKSYELQVYGGGGDFFRARRFAKREKLNVKFHGNSDFETVYKELKNSHLDVLVSYNFDTFGMTLIEAASVGVPTFIVDPDLKETVPENSFLFADDPSENGMAKTLNDLLKHPEKIEKMSKILLVRRDRAKISHRVDKLEAIFADAIKQKH